MDPIVRNSTFGYPTFTADITSLLRTEDTELSLAILEANDYIKWHPSGETLEMKGR